MALNDQMRKQDLEDFARSMLPPFLEIKKSVNTAEGVWTKQCVAKGTMLGPYLGARIKTKQQKHKSRYCWEIYDNAGRVEHYVCGEETRSNWMRYVNCAASRKDENVTAVQIDRQIFYKVSSDLPANVEVLVWYGEDYATELGVIPTNKQPSSDSTGTVLNSSGQMECEQIIRRDVMRQSISSDDTGDDSENTDDTDTCTTSLVSSACAKSNLQPDKASLLNKVLNYQRREKVELTAEQQQALRDFLAAGIKPSSRVCSQCKKKLSSANSLKEHIRAVHLREKFHHCSQCSQAFGTGSNLKKHMRRLHTGERPYSCSYCEYCCADASTLKRHTRGHTGEKIHKCPQCDFRCVQSGSLKIHFIAKHSGEKLYQCELCEFRSAHSSNVKRHMSTMHK